MNRVIVSLKEVLEGRVPTADDVAARYDEAVTRWGHLPATMRKVNRELAQVAYRIGQASVLVRR